MSQTVQLTGIAWDHSRALPPLIATAQRYEETHCGVRIRSSRSPNRSRAGSMNQTMSRSASIVCSAMRFKFVGSPKAGCFSCAVGIGPIADKIDKLGKLLGIEVARVC